MYFKDIATAAPAAAALTGAEVLPVVQDGATVHTTVSAIAEKAVADAQPLISAAVTGLYDDRGNYDASTDLFPAAGGSGTAGAVMKGDIWTVSVAGTLGGTAVEPGDLVRALVDDPGQTAGNWAINAASGGGGGGTVRDWDLTPLSTPATLELYLPPGIPVAQEGVVTGSNLSVSVAGDSTLHWGSALLGTVPASGQVYFFWRPNPDVGTTTGTVSDLVIGSALAPTLQFSYAGGLSVSISGGSPVLIDEAFSIGDVVCVYVDATAGEVGVVTASGAFPGVATGLSLAGKNILIATYAEAASPATLSVDLAATDLGSGLTAPDGYSALSVAADAALPAGAAAGDVLRVSVGGYWNGIPYVVGEGAIVVSVGPDAVIPIGTTESSVASAIASAFANAEPIYPPTVNDSFTSFGHTYEVQPGDVGKLIISKYTSGGGTNDSVPTYNTATASETLLIPAEGDRLFVQLAYADQGHPGDIYVNLDGTPSTLHQDAAGPYIARQRGKVYEFQFLSGNWRLMNPDVEKGERVQELDVGDWAFSSTIAGSVWTWKGTANESTSFGLGSGFKVGHKLSIINNGTGILSFTGFTGVIFRLGNGVTAPTMKLAPGQRADFLCVQDDSIDGNAYFSVAPVMPISAVATLNGTGSASIIASRGIASISKVSTGIFDLTFTTPMPDANYAVFANSGHSAGGDGAVRIAIRTSTGFRIVCLDQGGTTLFDSDFISVKAEYI